MGRTKLRLPLEGSHAPVSANNKRILLLLVVIFWILSILFVKPPLALALHINKKEFTEAEQIEKYKEYVKRDGDTLLLQSSLGTYISLTNSPECYDSISCVRFKFFDYYKDLELYVIEIYYYEGSEIVLVSASNGIKYYVYELPMFSPDKSRFVTTPNNLDTASGKSGVFVYRIEGSKIISEFSYEPRGYVWYEFVKWSDNKFIELDKWLDSSKGLCPETRYMIVPVSLRKEVDGWKLYEDFSPESVKCDTNYIKEAGE